MDLEKMIMEAEAKFAADSSAENLAACKALYEMKEIKEAQQKSNSVVEKTVEVKDEVKEWANKVMDAIAVGSTYSGLVPVDIAREVEKKIGDFGVFRPRCTVHKASGTYKLAVEDSLATVYYTAEAGAYTESTPAMNIISLDAFKLTALVKMSKESIADPVVDFVEYVTYAIAKAYALKEDHEILLGAGVNTEASPAVYNMTGVLTALKAQADTPQIVTDTTALGAFTWASLKSMMQKLGKHRAGSVLVMQQATCDYIHEFKDDGKYIFDQNKPLDSIWGMPIIISTDVDAVGDTKYPIIAGNFRFYHIADRQDLEIRTLNELYAANGQVGIIADKRVDGKPSQLAAFAALKLDF